MKKITVLGPGCPRCNKMAQLTEDTAKALGIEYEFEKITDITQIAQYGVMATPVLMIDGQIKIAGKVPTYEELKKILS